MDTPALSKVTFVFMAPSSPGSRAGTRRQFWPGTPAARDDFGPPTPARFGAILGCMSPGQRGQHRGGRLLAPLLQARVVVDADRGELSYLFSSEPGDAPVHVVVGQADFAWSELGAARLE